MVKGMVLTIPDRIKGFLFSPTATFDASKEDTIGDAFKYFVVILVIYAVLLSIVALAVVAAMGWLLNYLAGPLAAMIGLASGPILAGSTFISTLIGGIIGVFIGGLWLHIWVYLVGGRSGVEQTIKALMYGATPSLLLGWIPFIGILAAIWAIVVAVIGVRQLQELTTGRAVAAVILAILIPVIVVGVVVAAVL